MFKDITTAYDGTSATWEIAIMLLVAFVLGYLFKKVLDNSIQSKSLGAGESTVFAKYKQDDLTIVEGIGPKIAELLKNNDISDWKALAKADTSALKDILKSGGERFAMHDPSSWADQASLAHEGKWEALEKFQDLLIGGRTS